MTQNTKQSHKPFNLQAALEGAPVKSRNNEDIIRVFYVPEMEEQGRVIALFKSGKTRLYYENGRYSKNNDAELDLVMAPIKKTGWVNVYKDYSNNYFSSNIYTTQVEALVGRKCDNYITTTKIEWEE